MAETARQAVRTTPLQCRENIHSHTNAISRLDSDEKARKKTAREGHQRSKDAQNLRGFRAKMLQQQRHKEKIQMRKRIKAQEERNVKSNSEEQSKTPVPHYLLDRSNATNAKALSSAVKDRRNEKAAKFSVPVPTVRGISEEEMFKVVTTGKKTKKKAWKRVITKPTFVGPDFTRRAPKYERFIRYVSPAVVWSKMLTRSSSLGQWVCVRRKQMSLIPNSVSPYNCQSSASRRIPRTLYTHNWVF